jgi:hypothetical protein
MSDAKRISIAARACRIERAPVNFSISRDSPSWWKVPLPRVGGMPYTTFDASMRIDGLDCRAKHHSNKRD